MIDRRRDRRTPDQRRGGRGQPDAASPRTAVGPVGPTSGVPHHGRTYPSGDDARSGPTRNPTAQPPIRPSIRGTATHPQPASRRDRARDHRAAVSPRRQRAACNGTAPPSREEVCDTLDHAQPPVPLEPARGPKDRHPTRRALSAPVMRSAAPHAGTTPISECVSCEPCPPAEAVARLAGPSRGTFPNDDVGYSLTCPPRGAPK